ncbi:MAG: hypothetical protein RR962_12985 [Hafnia sp.]
MTVLMSKSEYAKHRGVSRQTVYDWVEKGALVLVGKKIDVKATAVKLGIADERQLDAKGKVLEMTWNKLLNAMLKTASKKAPERTHDDVIKRLTLAANVISFSVEPWENGFRLYAGSDSDFDDSGFYVMPNSNNNPELDTLDCIRGVIFSNAMFDPDGELEITEDEFDALCEPLINAR